MNLVLKTQSLNFRTKIDVLTTLGVSSTILNQVRQDVARFESRGRQHRHLRNA